MESRNLAALVVSPEFVYMTIHGWRKEGVINLMKLDWPRDATFISCNWIVEKQAFFMVFEHESFPAVEEGCEVPRHQAEVTCITLNEDSFEVVK